MKKILRVFLVSIVLAAAMPAAANAAGKPGTGTGTGFVGNDISWPQCGTALPTGHVFGIVGVNGGTAATTNPCLAQQLSWAFRASGASSQPKAQLYVNTANPGEVISQITTWPTGNTDKTGFTTSNPYGVCTGGNDMACSWQYGWNRAVEAVVDRFQPAAAAANVNPSPSAYVWWLDVETENTWQSGSTPALERNRAALEGMAGLYKSKGAKVGVYSTGYQWGVITGNTVGPASNLYGLDSWLAGARNLKDAQAKCAAAPLTAASKVTLTQYVSGSLDYDYSCLK